MKSIPYACLGAPVQKQFSVKDGDAMAWIKKEYPGYDVVISNGLTTPYIELIHPELVKDFYLKDNA